MSPCHSEKVVRTSFRAGPKNMPTSIHIDSRDTDVSSKLSELFTASGGTPIRWGDQDVHMMLELTDLRAGSELRIKFEQPNPSRPQALRLKSRDGDLELNGRTMNDVALWSDSAPDLVLARLRPKQPRKSMRVRVWNAWRDGAGSTQAWIGNSGMLIEESPGGVTVVKCSDGFGDPTFDDLIARVEVVLAEPSH